MGTRVSSFLALHGSTKNSSCGDTRGGVMNWRRKSPSHRARAEQGLEDTVGLDGWVGHGIPGRENSLARGFGGSCLARVVVNH